MSPDAFKAHVTLLAETHGVGVYKDAVDALVDSCFNHWDNRSQPPDFEQALRTLRKKHNDDWGT